MSIALVVGIVIAAVVVIGYIVTLLDFTTRLTHFVRRRILKRKEPSPASTDDVARLEAKLNEIQDVLASSPTGLPPLDTSSLAAQATEGTEQLLQQALELQKEHREREAIERLLTAYDMNMPTEARIELHLLVGNSFTNISEFEEAEGHYRQALSLAQEAADPMGEAAALTNLAQVRRYKGDLSGAETTLSRAVAMYREMGDAPALAIALNSLGLVYADTGYLEKAEDAFREVLKLDTAKDSPGWCAAVGNLGNVHLARDHLDLAADSYDHALILQRKFGNHGAEADVLGNLGNLCRRRGEYDQAKKYLEQALALSEQIGSPLRQAADHGNLGLVYQVLGDLDGAQGHHERALSLAKDVGGRSAYAKALGNLGNVHDLKGDRAKARRCHEEALAIERELGDRVGEAQELASLGLMAEEDGDIGLARELLTQARDLLNQVGVGGDDARLVNEALRRLDGPTEDASR